MASADVPRPGPVYRFAASIAFAIMRLQRWRFHVTGLDHVPTTGGAVIAANHTSYWDFFTTGWAPYHRMRRPVRILAKESLFRVPVFGWLMKRARHIPVHRGAGTDAFHSAVEALEERHDLVFVLPEQTISESFDLLPLKTGAARMAIRAQVPLVPAISWGTQRFHTMGRRLRPRWRLPVRVVYGEPLRPAPDADPEAVTEQLRERMQVLLDDAIATYPDGAPEGAWWVPARLGGAAPTHDEVLAEHAERERAWRARKAARAAGRTPDAGAEGLDDRRAG